MDQQVQGPPAATLRRARRARRGTVAAVAAFVVIVVAGEAYAKWWPYACKAAAVVAARTFKGSSILARAGAPGAAPTWHGTWSFTAAYGLDIWVALVAAMFIGAAVEVLFPRRALLRVFGRRTSWGASLAGGVLAVPCLMCTCCASPITVSLRRSKVPVAGALSYWLGNPLLNPAVLIYLAIVLPWQYLAARIAAGAVLVFAAAPLVARLAGRAQAEEAAAVPGLLRTGPGTPAASGARAPSLRRYLRAVVRLAAYLLPEYFAVVLALGAFRGWLLPLGHPAATWGFGAVAVAAVAGTLLVIPTAAEIPVILALTALGLPIAVTGALVVALPALSLASMAMVGRALSWRVTATMAGTVMVAAAAAGGLAAAL